MLCQGGVMRHAGYRLRLTRRGMGQAVVADRRAGTCPEGLPVERSDGPREIELLRKIFVPMQLARLGVGALRLEADGTGKK